MKMGNLIFLDRKGLTGEALEEILLWVVFIVIAGGGIYFLIKFLTQ